MRSPLAEVFGYPASNLSNQATEVRANTLCPFKLRGDVCTKDKKDDPLGACSIHHQGSPIIICPVRFEEDRQVLYDTAKFFFDGTTGVEVIPEARLKMENGSSAGNIDFVLVKTDGDRITDFGGLEIRSVYVSGSSRDPFARYMDGPEGWQSVDWDSDEADRPRPDYLSSSRKRLVPQLIQKGRVLGEWDKKQAVAIQRSFYDTLPSVERVPQSAADLAWFIYDLKPTGDRLTLIHQTTVYTTLKKAVRDITTPQPGSPKRFLDYITRKRKRLDADLTL